jgi:2'-hydroxyisoflavone reductase
MKRRTFVKTAGSACLLATLPTKAIPQSSRSLDILVLGGRDFLGPAIVKSALNYGHQVTLFNRNLTNPDLFTNLPLIIGDRSTGLNCYQPLKEKTWDVVIDVWPQESRLVDEATDALSEHARHYIFISSIAVYADYGQVGLDEESQTVGLPENTSDWGYSEGKARSEQIIVERFPDNHTILRPGPIKGWRDPAVDVAYWLLRMQKGKQVLAPGTGQDPIQFIDVKDAASFAISCAQEQHFGIFNTTGPLRQKFTFKEFLESCKAHTGSNAEIVWVPESFLRENQVRSFDDMPLWIPLHEDPGFMQISNIKSEKYGFVHSKLSSTYSDILKWFQQGLDGSHQFGRENDSVGLTIQREQELLARWRT